MRLSKPLLNNFLITPKPQAYLSDAVVWVVCVPQHNQGAGSYPQA